MRRLSHHGRRDGPVVVEVDLERGARAVGLHGVVIAARVHWRANAARGRWGGVGNAWVAGHRLGKLPGYIVDEAGVVLAPGDQPHGRTRRNRHVDEPFRNVATV